MGFKKAVRKSAKARIGICGPAGAGKTHSALLMAAGLAPGGRVAVICTERGSAAMEAGKPGIPDFDIMEIVPPYQPEKFMDGLKDAGEAGYDVCIIDSLSHAWSGPGGVLDMVDRQQSGGGNKFAAWRKMTPLHNQMVDSILAANMHVICTMRTKVEWVLEKNDKGKQVPKKVGLSPVQREGMEYEFSIVLDVDQETHYATASKDRTSLFDGAMPAKISVDSGKMVLDWLNSGAEVEPEAAPQAAAEEAPKTDLTVAAKNRLASLAGQAGFDSLDEAGKAIGIEVDELTMATAKTFAEALKARAEEKAA